MCNIERSEENCRYSTTGVETENMAVLDTKNVSFLSCQIQVVENIHFLNIIRVHIKKNVIVMFF